MTRASCHCGAVQIETDALPETLTQCNCSICRRHGALWAHGTRQSTRVVSGADQETAYLWGDRLIEFYHCNRCGCVTRYESVEKLPSSRVSINARMLAPDDIAGLRVRTFDGADTWQFID